MQKKGITVPIIQEQPPSDALYKFSMQKPSNVNVVGSYALRTIAKTKKAFNVDVAVEMPSVSAKCMECMERKTNSSLNWNIFSL